MNDRYIFQKPPKRSRYSAYKHHLKLITGLLIVVGVLAAFIYANLHGSAKINPQISPVQDITIASPIQTFTNPYFKFTDSGKWVLNQKSTTPSEVVYIKYAGQVIQGQVDVYINQVPISLYLATSRVLAVRIVNNNSFQVTGVSDPCSNQYAKGAPHRVGDITINGATMLCDPDTPNYTVVISQIEGDYRLHLQRANGNPIQFVIVYTNQSLQPNSQSILNIASSFQAL
jgi:hypothetical protein